MPRIPKGWKSAIFVAGFAALMIVGYDQIAELLSSGSIKSFDKCFQDGKNAGSVTSRTVKKACIERYQRRIKDTVEGTASYKNCLPEDEKNKDIPRTCGRFGGTISNNSAKFVVTSLKVYVKHNDTAEEETTLDQLWLEGDQSYDFSFEIKQKIPEADKGKGKFKWRTGSEKGFEIDY